MSDDLRVVSGPDPVAVTVGDLEAAALRLLSASREVAGTGALLLAVGVDLGLVAGALRSPATATAATEALARAGRRVLAEAVALGDLGARVGVAVLAYDAAEQAAGAAVRGGAAGVVAVLLPAAPALVLVGLGAQRAGVDVGGVLGRVPRERLADGVEVVAAGAGPALPALVAGISSTSRGTLLTEHGAVVVTRTATASGDPPRGVGDLVEDLRTATSAGADGERVVRVLEVPQPDGSTAWVVEVPGTRSWGPVAGRDPFDLTSNVLLLDQQEAAVTHGVAAALADAQAAAGRTGRPDPVLLVGHSQGGMTATAVAGSRALIGRSARVLLLGAPASGQPVPAGVPVLAVEHRQDLVPRLDGADDPRQDGWVTVDRDLGPDPPDPHGLAAYADTARLVDASADPAVREWLDGARGFLGEDAAGPVVRRDYALTRTGPAR